MKFITRFIGAAPQSEKALLSGPYSFGGPVLLFRRLWLYRRRLELTGWSIRGRYRRTIEMQHILQVDMSGDSGLVFWLSNGQTLRLYVSRPLSWKSAIDRRLANDCSHL